MLVTNQIHSSVRILEADEDFAEARLEAVGFIFHGIVPPTDGKKPAVRARSNVLHFARCPKLEKTNGDPDRLWFRTIKVAKQHLDEHVGDARWKWCKHCQQDVTQRMINEA